MEHFIGRSGQNLKLLQLLDLATAGNLTARQNCNLQVTFSPVYYYVLLLSAGGE